jgi:hypothetical protein
MSPSNNLTFNQYLPQLREFISILPVEYLMELGMNVMSLDVAVYCLFPGLSDRCVKLRLRMRGGNPPQL